MERSKTLPRNEEILTTRTNFNRGFDTSRTDADVKNYSVDEGWIIISPFAPPSIKSLTPDKYI